MLQPGAADALVPVPNRPPIGGFSGPPATYDPSEIPIPVTPPAVQPREVTPWEPEGGDGTGQWRPVIGRHPMPRYLTIDHYNALKKLIAEIEGTPGPPGPPGPPGEIDLDALDKRYAPKGHTHDTSVIVTNHVCVIADKSASYWPWLRADVESTQEVYHRMTVVPPPVDGNVGLLPKLVIYRDSTPTTVCSGLNDVREKLRQIRVGLLENPKGDSNGSSSS